MSSVVVITSGQRKFTHWNMKVKMPSTTIAGFISGSTILRKIWNSLAPSSRAASTRPSGSVEMNCRIMKTPSGLQTIGRIIPGYVLTPACVQPGSREIMM